MSKQPQPKKRKTEEAGNMTSAPEQFEGFMIADTNKWSDFKREKV